MRQRLLVMHDVARWKWNSRVPVTDLVREQTILNDIVAQSKQHGLDPAFVRDFFVAQFDAAKRLQEDDIRRWEAEQQGAFTDVPDLASELRPKIDNINGQLLTALAAVRPLLHGPAVPTMRERAAVVLNANGITREIRDAAIGPLVVPPP
jgi:chorismate mutase